MKVSVHKKSIFSCEVERAFKAPILGDATQFLNGYLFQPPIIGFENDENWGLLNSVRYPLVRGKFFFLLKLIEFLKIKSLKNVIINIGNGSLPTSLLLIYFLPVGLLVHKAFRSSLMEKFLSCTVILIFQKICCGIQ